MKTRKPLQWSAHVIGDSLKVPPGTFVSKDPRRIAQAVKAAAERGPHRRERPYASAMSYLCFYLNRGGRNLAPTRRRIIERAKTELRALFKRQ